LLERECQKIIDIRADDMDRSEFYTVVATLQGMVSGASATAPHYKQLVSKTLFTTSRCARLLQYMDIKETTMAMTTNMSSLSNPRRGSVPVEMNNLGRSLSVHAVGCSPVREDDETCLLTGEPRVQSRSKDSGEVGGSQGGWVRVDDDRPARKGEILSELANEEAAAGAEEERGWSAGRSSFAYPDAHMRHSFDDMDALHTLLNNLKENTDKEGRKRTDSREFGRPMQCHICDRLVKRSLFEEHTEICVSAGHITDALRNCDSALVQELVRINLLLGASGATLKSPRKKLAEKSKALSEGEAKPKPDKPKHRRQNSFSRLLDPAEFARYTEAKLLISERDIAILEQFKEGCEEAGTLLEKTVELHQTQAMCEQVVTKLDAAMQVGSVDSVVHEIVKEMHPRIAAQVHEKRKLHAQLAKVRVQEDETLAGPESPHSEGDPRESGDASRDRADSSRDREKKVSIKDFAVLKPISHGAYGAVFLARKKSSGDLFAIKKLKKDHMVRKKQVEHVMRERNIMATTNNPFLVKLFYTFQTKATLYFIMEFCQGGDLASLLKVLGGFESDMVLGYVGEMVLALEYLKSQMIVHRDLKPDNILVAPDGHIKLTDFGLSYGALVEHVLGGSLELFDEMGGRGKKPAEEAMSTEVDQPPEGEPTQRFSEVGTPHYLAPEILTGIGHSYPVDYWALGVMTYEFYVGEPPFQGDNLGEIFERITTGAIEWPEPEVDNIPEEGKDLIRRLLTIDPERRLGSGPQGMTELKAHGFFRAVDWATLLERPAVFIPNPDDETDTAYFAEKSDEENIAEWSVDSSSSAASSLGSFQEWVDGDASDDDAILSPEEDSQFLGFSFRNLDHLKGLNIGELKRERGISEDGTSVTSQGASASGSDRISGSPGMGMQFDVTDL